MFSASSSRWDNRFELMTYSILSSSNWATCLRHAFNYVISGDSSFSFELDFGVSYKRSNVSYCNYLTIASEMGLTLKS